MELTFGQMIKVKRKEKGLNQQELADLIGVSKSSISYYEKDLAKEIPIDVRLKLCKHLEIPLKSQITDIKAMLSELETSANRITELIGVTESNEGNKEFIRTYLRIEDDVLVTINKSKLNEHERACLQSLIQLFEDQHKESEAPDSKDM